MTARRSLLHLLALLTCPLPLAAQAVSGVVLLPDSVTPAPAVLVQLHTGSGTPRQALTDARGRFAFRLDRADSVTLRAMRPGLRPTIAPARFVAAGATSELRLILGAERVALAPVTVTEDRGLCGLRADAAAWQLWDEARTVLASTALAERDSSLQIRTIEYEGVPGADGEVEMVDSTLRVVPLGDAFGEAHYDSLFRYGYIRRNTPGVTTYYAPNARLLTDERFAATHCFIRAPEDTLADDVVGVRFEPMTRPRYTDVVGTFWLDVATYKLRRIDFTYVNPPPRHRVAGTGGTVEFSELKTGHWIMRAWTIRMSNPSGGYSIASAGSSGSRSWPEAGPVDFGLWARRQVVFQVTQDESLLMRDAAADLLARRVPLAKGP
ncbi:MAG: carboxypeptidase-like regulatory domain-containing protein [Gemmatimonadetes bacterium]|nr:carboxypeptidase-like regulatory domain-containing protein [Gemmatimonadota bacterium]